ncbi:MAG: aldo/keto reductase [Candidatus Aminicenantes bacterium]|nr:aldo/keto reductase [Candidatus Aminicenantes bacterium]
MALPLRALGRSDVRVSPVGLGCWQFSQRRGWNKYWPKLHPAEIEGIIAASLDGGVNWFDTAEAYGGGESEKELSRVLQKAGRKPGELIVATKWMPVFRTARSLTRTIDERLACLAPYTIDLHQIHNPASFSSTRAQMEAMAGLVASGKIRSVGVSNFGAARMRESHRILADKGLPLVSNQVSYSLINRRIEQNGVLEAARELGITIIAYSPLSQGVLSGRFHDDPARVKVLAGPRKYRGFYRRSALEKTRPVIEALKEIGDRRRATPAQVALNWLFSFHGESVVVIPGATKTAQAAANAAAMSFVLTRDELDHLDRVSRAAQKTQSK